MDRIGVPLLPLYILLLPLQLPFTQELSMGGGSPLYTENDKILILNNSNFQPSICGSDKAWMVEFYSSWCGHCIHFAPTYKELAADVYGWRDVISVGAIDCAAEVNMPTCREYEVMGYPSLKFFSPSTPAGDMGEERSNRDKSIPAIKHDMVMYLKQLQASGVKERVGKNWPSLLPANVTGETVQGLWDNQAVLALLLVEEVNATLGSEVMLDMWATVTRLKVPLNIMRVEIGKDTETLLAKHSLPKNTGPGIMALARDGTLVDSFPGLALTREAWYAAVKDFIWRKSSELSLSQQKILSLSKENSPQEKTLKPEGLKAGRQASKKELINRRFKVFTSDLEKAVLYSISHEVAQHSSIAGQPLKALQDYVTVLEKYFPARVEMGLFLRQLRHWVHQHQDTVRGEDLSKWIQDYSNKHGLKPASDWIGCKGSEAKFGGYPCGLWSVWHSLTVGQAKGNQGEPREVLHAMQSYIEEFFGCRECARHFKQALQDGQAIKEEVETHNDAVLFLWKIHNKANLRLQGDISEDPVFPKIVFPPREFCTECYQGFTTGSNLWDEYNHKAVLNFLNRQYGLDRLSSQGLSGSATALGHALAPVEERREETFDTLDTGNFRKEENSTSFIFFNGADLSICFMLWGASAVLLMAIYLKFFSGKRFCQNNSYFFSQLKRRSGLSGRSTPLLPK